MTREYSFEEHFWENTQINGYVVLMNRMKYAKQTCEKLKVVYESRIILEENYANQILCMADVLQSCNETGQFGHALNIMDTQWENVANSHLDMATKLKQQIVFPLVELLNKQKQIRKQLETNIKRLYNNRQLQSRCVLRALDRYNTECTKANELMQNGSRDEKQLAFKRSKTIIKQCFIAYEDSLADLEDVSEQWNEQWQHTCKEFELLEVERLEFLKTNLQAFNQVFIDISELTIDSYKPINSELELMNVDEDLDFFVKEFGGSNIMPNANDYFKLHMSQDKIKDNNDDETISISNNNNDPRQLTRNKEKLIIEEDDKKENNNNDDDDGEEDSREDNNDEDDEDNDDVSDIQDDFDTINDQELKNKKVDIYEDQFVVGRFEIYNSDDESSDFDNSEDCYSEDVKYENENNGKYIVDNETNHMNVECRDHLNSYQDTINNNSFHNDDMNDQEFQYNRSNKGNEDADQVIDNNENIENKQQTINPLNKSNKISFDMMDENNTIPKELLENYIDQHQHDNKDKLKDELIDQKINDNIPLKVMNDLKNSFKKKESTPIKRNPKKLPEINTQSSLKYKPSSSPLSQQQQQKNVHNNNKLSSISSPPPVPKHQFQSSTDKVTTESSFSSSSPIEIEDNNNNNKNENILSPTSSLSSSSVHEELEDMLRQLEKQNKKPIYNNKLTTLSTSSNKMRLSGVRQPRQRYSKKYVDKQLLDELSEKNELNDNNIGTLSRRVDNRFNKSTITSSSLVSSLAKNSLSIAKPTDKSNKWTLEEATQAMSQALPSKRHPLPKQPTDVRI